MTGRFRHIWVLALAAIILVGLIAAVYAAPSHGQYGKKEDSHKQAIGKNWDNKGSIKPKGMPKPKKNLRDASDPTSDRALIETRPHPSRNDMSNNSGAIN